MSFIVSHSQIRTRLFQFQTGEKIEIHFEIIAFLLLVPSFIDRLTDFVIVIGASKTDEEFNIGRVFPGVIAVTVCKELQLFVHQIALHPIALQFNQVFLRRGLMSRFKISEFEDERLFLHPDLVDTIIFTLNADLFYTLCVV